MLEKGFETIFFLKICQKIIVISTQYHKGLLFEGFEHHQSHRKIPQNFEDFVEFSLIFLTKTLLDFQPPST